MEFIKNKMLATKDMMKHMNLWFEEVSDTFKLHLASKDTIMLYLGMSKDLVDALLVTDTKTVIAIGTTDTKTNNTVIYPHTMIGNDKLLEAHKTSIVMNLIIRDLKALDVTDICCRFLSSTKFSLKFTFNNKKRKLIYYNKDYKTFFPDAITDIVEGKTLILSYRTGIINQQCSVFEKYKQLMLVAKETYLVTNTGYGDSEDDEQVINSIVNWDGYSFIQLSRGTVNDYFYRFAAIVECAIHSQEPRNLPKFLENGGVVEENYYLYKIEH
jgi:hypothetical protein